MMPSRFLAFPSAFLALACGSNAPQVPEELLVGTSGCAAPVYPEDGFGTEPGDVVENRCLEGYRMPDRLPPSTEHRETVAFSDYYDPIGSKGVALLLINTAAIWCSACVAEHGTLSKHQVELGPQGLVIVSALFEDAQRNPATFADLDRWIDNFHSNFPMLIDPEAYLGTYASNASAPLNLLVDPRSMKILRKYVGDQGTVMWPYIEAELKARSAGR